MSAIIQTQEQLLAYREQLRNRYLSMRIATMLKDLLGYPARTTLDDLKRSVHRRMDFEFQANGPNDCLWNALFEQRWFDKNEALDPAERLRRVNEGLESIELTSSDFTGSFFAQACRILAAQPRLKRSSHGFIANADSMEGDSIIELQPTSNGRMVISSVHDIRLSWYLVQSWKFSKDHQTAHVARQALEKDFWNAWEAQCIQLGNEFDQYAFVADARLENDHLVRVRNLYTDKDGVMHWDTEHPDFITFDDEGLCQTGDTDPEGKTRFFAVPQLFENTRRFHQWADEQKNRGYENFSRYYWTSHGIMSSLRNPLIRNDRLFGRSRLPEWSLEDALMEGMRTLGLDQAFFGEVLMTRKEYVRHV